MNFLDTYGEIHELVTQELMLKIRTVAPISNLHYYQTILIYTKKHIDYLHMNVQYQHIKYLNPLQNHKSNINV